MTGKVGKQDAIGVMQMKIKAMAINPLKSIY